MLPKSYVTEELLTIRVFACDHTFVPLLPGKMNATPQPLPLCGGARQIQHGFGLLSPSPAIDGAHPTEVIFHSASTVCWGVPSVTAWPTRQPGFNRCTECPWRIRFCTNNYRSCLVS
jgi:hypothetical protein